MKKLTLALVSATLVLSSVPALAKTKRVTVVKPTSTTIVEQHANGSVDTITTTPTGFTIQNGMPFVPTSVVVTPSYSRVVAPVATTTVVPTVATGNTIVNTVDANGVPMTTVVEPTAVVSTTTTTPVVTAPIVTTPVVTTPVVTAPVIATPTVVVAP